MKITKINWSWVTSIFFAVVICILPFVATYYIEKGVLHVGIFSPITITKEKEVVEVIVEKTNTNPLDNEEVAKLADCIIKLQPKTTPWVAKYISMHTIKESKEKGLDYDLVTALMYVESMFNVNALSTKGAVGLMQVRYSTWKEQPELVDNGVGSKHKLYWIELNIKCGTDILAKYLAEAKGNMAAALFRYNTGDPKLTKAPWEVEYINKIFYYYYKIREHRLHGTPLEEEEIAAASMPVVSETQKAAVKK